MAQLATAEAEPLFNSAYDAIAFAYRFNSQQYAMTPMAKLMRGQIGSGKGLVGLDGAAQAGFIRGLIEQLGEWEKAALAARFAFDRKELFKARDTLIIPALASLPTGVHHRRMVDALVQKHFGRKVWLKEIAELYGINKNTMTDQWRIIRKTLHEIECRAMDKAEAALRESGVCL